MGDPETLLVGVIVGLGQGPQLSESCCAMRESLWGLDIELRMRGLVNKVGLIAIAAVVAAASIAAVASFSFAAVVAAVPAGVAVVVAAVAAVAAAASLVARPVLLAAEPAVGVLKVAVCAAVPSLKELVAYLGAARSFLRAPVPSSFLGRGRGCVSDGERCMLDVRRVVG